LKPEGKDRITVQKLKKHAFFTKNIQSWSAVDQGKLQN